MKKILVIMIATILLLGISGCINVWSEPNGEAPPAQGQGLSIGQEAQREVDIANANNLATAINAYTALHPDSGPLPDNITIEDVKEALSKSLWPKGLSDEEAQRAWRFIVYKDGLAELDPYAQ